MLRRICICVTLLVLALAPMGVGAAEKDILASRIHLHLTQPPQNIGEWLKEALDNELIEVAAIAVATFFCGCPEEASEAVGILKLVLGGKRDSGEEHYATMRAPSGYVLCNASLTDFNTAIGRGSLGLSLRRRTVEMYTWLQKRNLSQGRSSFDVWVEVVAVKLALYKNLLREKKCLKHGTIFFDAQWWPGDRQKINVRLPKTWK